MIRNLTFTNHIVLIERITHRACALKVSWSVDASGTTHITAQFTLIDIATSSSISFQCKPDITRAYVTTICILAFLFTRVSILAFIHILTIRAVSWTRVVRFAAFVAKISVVIKLHLVSLETRTVVVSRRVHTNLRTSPVILRTLVDVRAVLPVYRELITAKTRAIVAAIKVVAQM